MKRRVTFFLCMAIFYGCGHHQQSVEDATIAASRGLISAVRTNATIKTIKSSGGVRGLLGTVNDMRNRSLIISEWRDSLFCIQIQNLTPANQYGVIREASSVLDWDVACAMRECGDSMEVVWNHRLAVVDWLDGQVGRMRKVCDNARLGQRERKEAWNFYQAIIEHREQFVENYERFYLNERDYSGHEQLVDKLRHQLSVKIGRRVRPAAEIKRLGFYAKQARERVLKERDAALRKPQPNKER